MDDEPFDEAEHGSAEPPPPDMLFSPARNAADFANFPPGWELAAAESREHAPERSAEAIPPEDADAA